MDRLEELRSLIPQAMLRDRHRLRKAADRLARELEARRARPQQIERLAARVGQSVALRQQRQAAIPPMTFSQELPILAYRDQIVAALDRHQVVVVAGETGSGKSTQLPKICLQSGLGVAGMIGHTQPRRIAARSVAARVAEELGSRLGEAVGFKIRFDDRTAPGTYIKLMTDGVLLAETQSDPFLEQYELIILDEAHERSLNIDFLLALLKRLLGKRPDLRLVITSATIDVERFADHFAGPTGPAPVIEVSGRTFPVEVRYRPLETEDDQTITVVEGIVAAVRELAAIDRGDMLVFLPTERDIRETARRLRGESLPGDGQAGSEILPLYARLSSAEQDRIFRPGTQRRIVLATNVAESSLTVPRIRYVVDTGTARISRYSPRLKVQRLPIEAISQASANQRSGRCGRTAPGICIRLFGQSDFDSRDRYTTPEIRRTDLAAVILQALALKLGDVQQLPFLDPPRADAIRDGYRTLLEIGATDGSGRLTPLGARLARLPVDPRIARMIVAAHEEDCLSEVLIIAAALEIQDPRLRPLDAQQAADGQHAKFAEPRSDFFSYLKLWDFYHDLRQTLSRSRLLRACQQNFLSLARLREWSEVHRQLRELVLQQDLRPGRRRDEYDAVHRALLTGLLSGVALRESEHQYLGAGGQRFHLWPGSGLFRGKPKWIVVNELVETTRRYGRTAARIDPRWLEPLAEHLIKRSYSDPQWHRKQATVLLREQVTLFGLPIVRGRLVPCGPIDATTARQLFLEHGLVQQELDASDDFLRHNGQVRQELAGLAEKTRRREYVVDDYAVYDFYDRRIPADVVDLASLRHWLRKRGKNTRPLHMAAEDLTGPVAADEADHSFPNTLQVAGMELPLRYRFCPGETDDGVTLTVPAEGLSQLPADRLGWLVPGLLEEKILALIRSLPKAIRRGLLPAPDTARRVASELGFGEGPFLATVASRLSAIAQEPIHTDDFRLEKLPSHLRFHVQVVDPQGNVQVAGRDLAAIRRQFGQQQEPTLSPPVIDSSWHRDGVTDWDFGTFPEEIRVTRAGIEVAVYPAILDAGDHVNLRVLDSPRAARLLSRQGIRRLYTLAQQRALRSQVRWLPGWQETCLYASRLLSPERLERQVQELIADRAFLGDEDLPRDAEQYRARLSEAGERIAVGTQDVAQIIPRLFTALHQASVGMENLSGDRWRDARQDMQDQLHELTRDAFLTDTPWNWLEHFPRYLHAIGYRIEKLTSGGQARDTAQAAEIATYWRRFQQWRDAHPTTPLSDDMILFRWMIEEYRVSKFAQPLGTALKVSAPRLERQWKQAN
jgi:ATP-dependent helicase HrpA